MGDIAQELGRDPWDVLCDIVVADELNTSFGTIPPPESDEDWAAPPRNLARPRRAVIGASDAGAHLDLLASFNYATELLGKAVRGHRLLSFEEAIHLLTDVQGRSTGSRSGHVAEGWYADLVVLDPGTVGSGDVAMRFDLPGGAGRLYANTDGIDHVLVNGRRIVVDGQLTDERSGTLLRSGRDTETAPLD